MAPFCRTPIARVHNNPRLRQLLSKQLKKSKFSERPISGLILAIPIVGALKIICDYIEPLRGLAR
jgi:hypothetical protein